MWTDKKTTAINQDLKALFPEKGVDPGYLLWLLKHLAPALQQQGTGSTVSGVTVSQVTMLPLYKVCRIETQRAIAAILDSVDEVIRQTEAVIAKLRQVKAGMLHDLLTCGLDENGELRDPIRHPEQFKDSLLGRIPNTWAIEKLGDVFSMQAGKFLSGQYIKEVGLFPVFGGNGLRGYASKYTHEGEYALIGRQGALCGNIAVASGRFYATEHAVFVAPIEEMNVGWIASCLNAMNLYRFSESSAQPGLSVQKLSNHKIKLPKLPEQEAIDFQLKSIDQAIGYQFTELIKLNSLKQGLMHDLLTGTIRVPASLLEATS